MEQPGWERRMATCICMAESLPFLHSKTITTLLIPSTPIKKYEDLKKEPSLLHHVYMTENWILCPASDITVHYGSPLLQHVLVRSYCSVDLDVIQHYNCIIEYTFIISSNVLILVIVCKAQLLATFSSVSWITIYPHNKPEQGNIVLIYGCSI